MAEANAEAIFAQSMAALQRGDFERAIRHGDRLLEASAHAPPAVVWGVRLRIEAKRWQEAIDLGLPSVDASPGLSGLVGQAFEELGDLSSAQALYERACREQPENPGWHFQNGSALSRLYREFESMESLRRAVKLAPDAGGLVILAGQELAFGNPEAALQAADRALALDPKIEGAHPMAARSLMLMGRFEEADDRWDLAIASAPGADSFPLQRAICLVRHGRFDAGIESLRSMIASNPGFVPAYVQIATAKKMSEEDRPLLDAMLGLLADEKIEGEDRLALEFAVGKAYDNLKEYGPAMAHFDEANKLQYRIIGDTGGFDREGYAANMALRMKVYSSDVVQATAAKGSPSELPIFVLGMIRSGTTLAEQILSSHPLVSGAGEQDFWINTDLRLMDYAQERLELQVLREAAEAYLRLLNGFARPGATRVVDKQPGNLILAGALHIAFPNARIIHMHRNHVDTAISIWNTHVRTTTRFVNDKGNIVHAFREHDKLMNHWRKVLPPDRFMDVSYESLITDRENMTRRILDFCGLPWSDECLSPEKNQKLVVTPSLWQVRQPIYRTSIDRWKNYEPWLGAFRQLIT